MPVPKHFKAHVIGKRGYVIQDIRQKSGAQIWSRSPEEEGFTVSGNAEQIARAKTIILEKVVCCNYKCLRFRMYTWTSF